MKRILLVFLTLFSFLIFNSCDTPINKYTSKNEDEKKILALLSDYQNSRNSNDIEKLKSTFHDDGVYISKDGIEWTKSKLQEQPEEWYKGQGSLEEMGDIQMYNPQIKISGDDAKVNTVAKYGKVYTEAHIFTLVKENDEWLIMRME